MSVKSEILTPVVDNIEVASLLPRNGEHPQLSSVIIRGVNTAVANGLRRIILSELDNFALNMDSWETDDPFIMNDMIARRILAIPIVQRAVHEGDKFALSIKNDTDEPMDIYSGQLRAISHSHRVSTALPFFETFILMTIQPHTYINLSASVISGNGSQDTLFATCSTAVSIPLDVRTIDPVTGMPGVSDAGLPLTKDVRYVASSAISDPRDFLLRFESCGKGDTKSIMARAIKSFIMRMEKISSAQIIKGSSQTSHARDAIAIARAIAIDNTGVCHMRIQDETRTIGEMFVRCALHLFPSLNYAASDMYDLSSELVIRLRAQQDDPAEIVRRTVAYAIEMLQKLSQHF